MDLTLFAINGAFIFSIATLVFMLYDFGKWLNERYVPDDFKLFSIERLAIFIANYYQILEWTFMTPDKKYYDDYFEEMIKKLKGENDEDC